MLEGGNMGLAWRREGKEVSAVRRRYRGRRRKLGSVGPWVSIGNAISLDNQVDQESTTPSRNIARFQDPSSRSGSRDVHASWGNFLSVSPIPDPGIPWSRARFQIAKCPEQANLPHHHKRKEAGKANLHHASRLGSPSGIVEIVAEGRGSRLRRGFKGMARLAGYGNREENARKLR